MTGVIGQGGGGRLSHPEHKLAKGDVHDYISSGVT